MTARAAHGLAALVVVLAVSAAAPSTAHACEACNLSFAEELMGERAETLAGQEMLRTMRNQGDLALAQSQQAQPPARRNFQQVFGDAEFIEIIRRDESLDTRPTSFVPQDVEPDKEFTIVLAEGQTYIGQGVMYDGFTTNGSVPGPTIVVTEGDIVRFNVENRGDVPHGASIHAAYTQTSKYVGAIGPGETKSVTFRATMPGVYMYHCAPGGHAIPMHVMFGQYGMIVVEPRDRKYRMEEELGRKPDVNLYLLQHEFFASGKDAIEGRPMYTAWNGKVFRYVEEPIRAKPGDYVRVHYLNVGPTQVSTFHLVGIVWDHVYWQGHPEARMPGGQTVTSGPSDSWVIEFRVPPDEGTYLMVDHSVNNTSRGAIGILQADRNAETPVTIDARGPVFEPAELERMAEQATRTISPFRPGTARDGSLAQADQPVVYGPDVSEVTVRIVGNSYYPKVIEIEPGTRVTWVNEDVFTYMQGEFAGIHNAVAVDGPELFATQMLAHAESDSFTFNVAGAYEYICTPHPYMVGRIVVREAGAAGRNGVAAARADGGTATWVQPVSVGALALALLAAVLGLIGALRRR